MGQLGLRLCAILAALAASSVFSSISPGVAADSGDNVQIAELPSAPQWKSGTIRRDSDGNPAIEPYPSEPQVQAPAPPIEVEQAPVKAIGKSVREPAENPVQKPAQSPSAPGAEKPAAQAARQPAPQPVTEQAEKNATSGDSTAPAAASPKAPEALKKADTQPSRISGQSQKTTESKKTKPARKAQKLQANYDTAAYAIRQAEMPALAKIVAKMEPGRWLQIPNTAIKQVLATRDMTPENGGVSGPESVISKWNGAAFDGRYWYFHGGGHRDYSGNEVYSFDFVDLTWSRLTDPSPFVYQNSKTGKWDARKSREHPCPRVPDLDGDGKFDAPVPGHTYDSIVYSPKTKTIFLWTQVAFCVGGNGWSGNPIWEFDPDSKSWSGHRPAKSKEFKGYRSAELDPATGNIILVSRDRMAIFDVETKEYTDIRKVNKTGSDGTGAIDPVRRLFVLSDRTGVRSTKLGNDRILGGLGNPIRRPAFNQMAGVAYNSRDKNLVYWPGDRRIFTLDPVANDWVLYENHGGKSPKGRRPFSKFLYIEALDVFAGYDHPRQGVWLYRLPTEKPPVDPNRFVKLCYGDACKTFKTLRSAFNAAKDGAVITIGGAIFYEAASLKANNVTIRGSKGTHLLESSTEGKATFVIKGNNTTIEGIECSGVGVSDGNGACVRLEGKNLTLRNVYFHDSQQGLLTRSKGGGSILIENSRFERLGGACGIKCGRAHGIYIGLATELVVRNSTFLSPKDEGHAIKSRAAKTTIENNVIASLDGKDSRLIDIPNGGTVVIRNNVLQEGTRTSNTDIIGIGLEIKYKNIRHELNSSVIEGNTIVIEPAENPRRFVHSRDVPAPKVSGNTIIGGEKPEGDNKWYKSRNEAGLGPYPALPKAGSAL